LVENADVLLSVVEIAVEGRAVDDVRLFSDETGVARQLRLEVIPLREVGNLGPAPDVHVRAGDHSTRVLYLHRLVGRAVGRVAKPLDVPTRDIERRLRTFAGHDLHE